MADSQGRASFKRSLGDALATADLRRLQLAWTAASVGGWVFFIVLAVYAYNEGGAAAVGVAALARMVPAGLAAPLAGVVVDRRSRREVLILITAGRAVLLAGIAAAVAAGAPLAVVLVLSALFTVLQTAHRPAQAALLPGLAETPRQIAASNAVWTAVDSIGFLLGALLAGVLVGAAGTETGFLVTAGLLAIATWPLARIPRDPVPDYREHEDEEGPLEELASGFRTVVGDPSLRLLVGVLSCSTFVEGAVDVLVVLVAIELLDLGDSGVGWLNSAWAFGGIVGGAAAISLLGRGRLAAGLAGGCLLVGVPLLLVAALPEVAMAVAMLVVLGVGYSLIETAGLTLLQRLTSDDVLGRAFAVVESSYWLTTGAGAMAAPAIVGLFGVRGALAAIGLCLPVVVALRWVGLARFEAGAAIPEAAFALLRSVPLFAPLSLGTLENVSRRLDEVEVSAGHAVVREGEPGERFYVIAEGEFEASNSRGTFPLLGEGDVFGEIALLRDIPRTATVTARTDGLLYALDRESFLAAVAGHRFASRSADSMVHERTERTPVS
ncbi:MAG TPA: MFS transporter [Thermoleophilaceae bacterium]|nr:MFS transporter [Thermoleophilaceae bacterium]